MIKTVYIETTIPSYYYETRKDNKSVAWREITRHWWKKFKLFYQPVCSDAVRIELEEGKHPNKYRKLALLDSVEYLDYLPIIDDIVISYIENKLVPEEFGGDAYHLAIASYYDIDFLLTWNCQHLANPNKFKHMHIINTKLKLNTPIICTPEQLLTDYKEV